MKPTPDYELLKRLTNAPLSQADDELVEMLNSNIRIPLFLDLCAPRCRVSELAAKAFPLTMHDRHDEPRREGVAGAEIQGLSKPLTHIVYRLAIEFS